MEKKRNYNVVLTPAEKDAFMVFCKRNNITAEPSGYGNMRYVAIYADRREADLCNQFLGTL